MLPLSLGSKNGGRKTGKMSKLRVMRYTIDSHRHLRRTVTVPSFDRLLPSRLALIVAEPGPAPVIVNVVRSVPFVTFTRLSMVATAALDVVTRTNLSLFAAAFKMTVAVAVPPCTMVEGLMVNSFTSLYLTVSVACFDTPAERAAVIVAPPALIPVTVNVFLSVPLLTITSGGALTKKVSGCPGYATLTRMSSGPAGPSRMTVPVEALPSTTVEGSSVKDLTSLLFTVSVAC